MNILFLTLGRLNNIEDSGIYTDLLTVFRDKGHNIYVVTPREKRLKLSTEYVYDKGVNYLKTKVGNITKTNLIEKGVSTINIERCFLNGIKKYMSNVKFDLVLYSTPPVTFGKVVQYIKKKDQAKSYLLLKDIFPQNAVDLNFFSKKNPIYWYFRFKEKKLYKLSDYIGCMSQANVDFIIKHNKNINKKPVEVCPNSIEPKFFMKSVEKINEVKSKYEIPKNKIIFVYGGNLGKPQGIDFLIECVNANKNNKSAYFLIVGSGTELDKLKNYFSLKKPVNAKILNQLPKNDYDTLLYSCDVGLIFLDKRFTIPNFPSRLLSYMEASMPVLAATDVNTDLGKIVENGDFGVWCESRNVEDFNKCINILSNPELRERMGKNARNYLEKNYTAKKSYDIIMNHFN